MLFSRAPFWAPQRSVQNSKQHLDVALDGIPVGMADAKLGGLLELAQQPPDLLPAVGVQPAIKIGVPIPGQRREGADAVVDLVLADAVDLGDHKFRRRKRLHELPGALLRRAQECETQMSPVQLPQLPRKGGDRLLLVLRPADESGVVGGVVAAHMDVVVEAAGFSLLRVHPQRKERHIGRPLPLRSDGQDEPGAVERREPFGHPCPGQEELRLGIGVIHGGPIGPQRRERLCTLDDVHTHDAGLGPSVGAIEEWIKRNGIR